VAYTSNAVIYGRKYGSGHCYRCRSCGAYVGTHEHRPKEAFGILSNAEMREWKIKCHSIFDNLWQFRNNDERNRYRNMYYGRLAEALNISKSDCHFGYFDMDMLKKAYEILVSGELKQQKEEKKR
jgi:hypothetical protein